MEPLPPPDWRPPYPAANNPLLPTDFLNEGPVLGAETQVLSQAPTGAASRVTGAPALSPPSAPVSPGVQVWSTPREIEKARMRRQSQDGTLFGAADGIIEPGERPTDTQFLASLLANRRISQNCVDRCTAALNKARELSFDFLDDYIETLTYSSLPETYAYRDIANLLAETRELLDDPNTRAEQTGRVILEIIENLRKSDGSTLVEAFELLGLRHWNLATRYAGATRLINQAGLAYTLLTFSYTPFEAMTRAKRPVPSVAERDTWLRFWAVIGSMTGVETGGLPCTSGQAGPLLKAIRLSAGYGHSEQGRQLMKAFFAANPRPEDIRRFRSFLDADLLTLLGCEIPTPAA